MQLHAGHRTLSHPRTRRLLLALALVGCITTTNFIPGKPLGPWGVLAAAAAPTDTASEAPLPYLEEAAPRLPAGLTALELMGEVSSLGERAVDYAIPQTGSDVYGLDVSRWQGTIDWDALSKENIHFVIAKATESHFVDKKFFTNWETLREKRDLALAKGQVFYRGAYHFFRPQEDAGIQAQTFIQAVGRLEPGDFPPVLDVEWDYKDPSNRKSDRWNGLSKEERVRRIRVWLDAVEEALGRPPMIYTSGVFWNDKIGSYEDFVRYPLWLADYSAKSIQAGGPRVMPIGATAWSLWQFSSSGKVAGIQGNVDVNRYALPLDALGVLAGITPPLLNLSPLELPPGGKAHPPLAAGSKGRDVKDLQQYLVGLGYLTKDDQKFEEKTFGERTARGVKRFQKDAMLLVSGDCDGETWKGLETLRLGLKVGAHSPLVLRAKDRLLTLGYLSPRQVAAGTSLLGPKMEAGLMAFQRAKGLEATGVLELRTWRVLFAEAQQ